MIKTVFKNVRGIILLLWGFVGKQYSPDLVIKLLKFAEIQAKKTDTKVDDEIVKHMLTGFMIYSGSKKVAVDPKQREKIVKKTVQEINEAKGVLSDVGLNVDKTNVSLKIGDIGASWDTSDGSMGISFGKKF